MQQNKNLFNQDLRAAPAKSISSGHIDPGPIAFPDFSIWRAQENSSEKKFPEIYLSGGVEIFQSLDTSCIMSLINPILHPLRSRRIDRNRARTMLVSRPANQVV